MVIHCLNGTLLRALIGFGRHDDPRGQAAAAWAASRITGDGVEQWYRSGTSGPASHALPRTAAPAPGAP